MINSTRRAEMWGSAGRELDRPVRLWASLKGTGMAAAERVVTNEELISERGLETTNEWIVGKTGIRERRFVGGGEGVTSLAVQAGRSALERSGIGAEEVSLIIVATSTSEWAMPSVACLVQGELGARNAIAWDLNAACSGYVHAVDMAVRWLQTRPGHALVIGADCGSRLPAPNDRLCSIFFGDAAGAAVISTRGEGEVLSSVLHAAGGKDVLRAPTGGHIEMNGRALWDFVTTIFPRTIDELCREAGIGVEEISLLVPHQANQVMLEAAAKGAGIGVEKLVVNVDRLGNTLAASIPTALDEAMQGGRIERGDIVCLIGFGAGLAWGGQLWRM